MPPRPLRDPAQAIARRPGARLAGRDGFTLIEALVAFTVLALLMVVLQRGVVGTVDGALRAEARLEAGMVARTLMAGGLVAAGGAASSGRMNGHDWAIRFEPLLLPSGASGELGGSVFQPMRMIVDVALGDRGRGRLSVETVRLVRIGSGGAG